MASFHKPCRAVAVLSQKDSATKELFLLMFMPRHAVGFKSKTIWWAIHLSLHYCDRVEYSRGPLREYASLVCPQELGSVIPELGSTADSKAIPWTRIKLAEGLPQGEQLTQGLASQRAKWMEFALSHRAAGFLSMA